MLSRLRVDRSLISGIHSIRKEINNNKQQEDTVAGEKQREGPFGRD